MFTGISENVCRLDRSNKFKLLMLSQCLPPSVMSKELSSCCNWMFYYIFLHSNNDGNPFITSFTWLDITDKHNNTYGNEVGLLYTLWIMMSCIYIGFVNYLEVGHTLSNASIVWLNLIADNKKCRNKTEYIMLEQKVLMLIEC